MKTELFRRDDGWTRRIIHHEDGSKEYLDGLPHRIDVPNMNEYAMAVWALHATGYALVVE